MRRRRLPAPDNDAESLNITPYLDVLVNLIMFLLVTQAALIGLGVIDVTAPVFGDGDGKAHANGALKLTVGIAREGFHIAAKGGVLPFIPKRSDGQYDYAALEAELGAIKRAFPGEERLYVAADQDVEYDAVVKTLDAARIFRSIAFAEPRLTNDGPPY